MAKKFENRNNQSGISALAVISVIVTVMGLAVAILTFYYQCIREDSVRLYSSSYKPPEEPGDVYVVINKGKKSNIFVSYEWGPHKGNGNMDVSGDKKGIVLHLNHSDYGSYPLKIKSDEKIITILQYQNGIVPNEWNNKQYRKVWW